jgi:hypothetical protein
MGLLHDGLRSAYLKWIAPPVLEVIECGAACRPSSTLEPYQHKTRVVDVQELSIQARLMMLRQEHRDLDDAINQLSKVPSTDQLRLRRMKKRKLRLRDQIDYWESKLIPDLDA